MSLSQETEITLAYLTAGFRLAVYKAIKVYLVVFFFFKCNFFFLLLTNEIINGIVWKDQKTQSVS